MNLVKHKGAIETSQRCQDNMHEQGKIEAGEDIIRAEEGTVIAGQNF